MLDFSHIANTANGSEFQVFSALGANDWQTIITPRGKTQALFIAINGGAGGGGGFSAASGARGGGGGGGSGGITRQHVFTKLLPDVCYANVALGGAGGASGVAGSAGNPSLVSLQPSAAFIQNRIAGGGTNAGGGGAGAAASVGAAGAAGTGGSAAALGLGSLYASNGVAGGAGGAVAGGVGTAVTWGNGTTFSSGGAGGGGTTSADIAGGAITAGGWFPSIAGGCSRIKPWRRWLLFSNPFRLVRRLRRRRIKRERWWRRR